MISKKIYKNERQIRLSNNNYSQELVKLDLREFPIIDDFGILARQRGAFGYHLYCVSPMYGLLASFPWWDHAEKDLETMKIENIPLGTIDKPFEDLEQSWQILIWEKRDYVYIMEGEDPCCIEFPVWFRVRKQRYIEEWDRILKDFAK